MRRETPHCVQRPVTNSSLTTHPLPYSILRCRIVIALLVSVEWFEMHTRVATLLLTCTYEC